MKTNIRWHLLSIGLGVLTTIGFAGSIAGSLAWWAYSTRASVSFQGTSVASSEQLQIGIKTSLDLSSFGMTKYPEGEGVAAQYYFAKPGEGLAAGTVAYYLEHVTGTYAGYAVDKLEPITSGSFTSGDTFSLKSSLIAGNRMNNEPAPISKYVKIPFAFKIQRYSGGVLTEAKGENIWLTDTLVEASSSSDGEVYKAIRLYCEGKEAYKSGNDTLFRDSKFLLNPSDKVNNGGQTAVGGPLNLNGDDYYDYDVFNNTTYEIIYGETNLSDDAAIRAIETTAQGNSDSNFDNFNEVADVPNPITEATTFTAKHRAGTYRPANLTAVSPKYANYETIASIAPTDNNGDLSGGKPLCATDLTRGIADLELTIWLEGWDHHVVDEENEHSFNLGLQFQINRI